MKGKMTPCFEFLGEQASCRACRFLAWSKSFLWVIPEIILAASFTLRNVRSIRQKKIIESIEIRLIQVTAVGKCSDVVIPTYSFEASYTVNLPPLSGRCFRNGLKSSGSRYWNDFSSRCVISLSRFCFE